MKLKFLITLSALAVLLILIWAFDKGADRGKIVEKTELAMGTIIQTKIPVDNAKDEKLAGEAIDKAFGEIRRIERVFSIFSPDSEVSRINRLAPGQTLKISGEVFDLIEKVKFYNERTDGAFDITVKPLVDLWRFNGAKSGVLPSEEELKNALEKVGMKYVILDKTNKTISFERPGMGLDFGGVAKGYATDRAISLLKDAGIRNAVVSCGGDVYCLGRRSPKKMWNVGIQHPRHRNKILFHIDLENMAVDTSGDYEKYYFVNNKRYSHIIDPRTGYPIGDDIVSATVIAKEAAVADILATSLCVLGKRGLDVARNIEGADAIIVHNENGILKSDATEFFMDRYNVKGGS